MPGLCFANELIALDKKGPHHDFAVNIHTNWLSTEPVLLSFITSLLTLLILICTYEQDCG